MKKLLSMICFVFASTVVAQNVNIELISYRVPITYSIAMQADPEKVNAYDLYTELFSNWYHNKLGPAEYDLFVHGVYEAATMGKIKVYDPFLISIKGNKVSFTEMQNEDVKNIGVFTDTVMIQYPYPPYDFHDTVFTSMFDVYNIVAIDFLETWSINAKTMDMKKKIIAFAPVMAIYDRNTGLYMGAMPMFWVKM